MTALLLIRRLAPYLLLVALLLYVLYIGFVLESPHAGIAPGATRCLLQDSKPIFVILLDGLGAGALCAKTITSSNGRYFAYYGTISAEYQVICAVQVGHVRYSVYDVIRPGMSQATRYSVSHACPLLQQHH